MADVTVFDMKSLKDRVTDSIKSTFVGLIPDDQWNKLVEDQTDVFIKIDLPMIVKEELKTQFKAKLLETLNQPDYQEMWNSKPIPGAAIQAIIKECAPELINALFGKVVQDTIMYMRNNMNRF